jgi:malate dehydrogenase (quinone)
MKMTASADFVLIGAGIMSATLGVFLKQLMPQAEILILERLDAVALESSDAWNNAGTGHAALCELNYTPQREDGSVDCSKAFRIDEQFEVSKQFWAFLVSNNKISPGFIQPVSHMSFVRGEEDIAFLRSRIATLTQNDLFRGMQFSDNWDQLMKWIPLMMKGRSHSEPVAASKMDIGSDVNFGLLTRQLVQYLKSQAGVTLLEGTEVADIDPGKKDHKWLITVRNAATGNKEKLKANFVFIGAGGGALTLLEKSGIPEAKGYGGFPVSGQWLRCINRDVIAQHQAKVYGKAAIGAPPMSVPHLDTRNINGRKELLFGPFAGFSTKFLKHGSYFDLPASLRMTNVIPMIQAGMANMSLTKYLIQQVMQSPEDRMQALRLFYPEARQEDWELAIAGQRVQVIKKDSEGDGMLEFGTEIVHNEVGNLAALLGASPGASTSVSIMLDLLKKCFPEQLKTTSWQQQLKLMIPTYGTDLATNGPLALQTRRRTHEILHLNPPLI